MRLLGKFGSFLAIVGVSTNCLAGPAAPIEIEYAQPDGTIIRVVPRGDEYASWYETSDGHSIVRVGDIWFYAEIDASGQLRATAIPAGSLDASELEDWPRHLAPTPAPEAFEPVTVRNIREGLARNRIDSAKEESLLALPHDQPVLTVLVDYTDVSFTYSDASFQSLVYGATDSVREFFLEVSYDDFTVSPASESFGTSDDGVIHVSRPVTHPNQGQNLATSRAEAREIVALTDPWIDYSAYDVNADGAVSSDELSIMIILAGYETSYGGAGVALTPNAWGHASGFSSLTLDGKTLSPYTMFGEAHATNPGDKHQATMGIICHELGHLMLGLPDLYDVDGSSNGIGTWGLMANGSWNTVGTWSGETPAHLSAWSKAATGMVLPVDIDAATGAASVASAHANDDVKRLWIDHYRSNEYFLVENRQQLDFDAGLPGSGLLIWHVDESQQSNANESRKWVDLEEADGLAELDSGIDGGDGGDPFPGTTANTTFDDSSNPNSRDNDGNSTQIEVSSISASGNPMTANLNPRAGGFGDHVRYDGTGSGSAFGAGTTTIWLGLSTLNDTAQTRLDGIDIFVTDPASATIDISYYSSLAGGTPSGLIHSETGLAAGPGWNRLLLTTSQSFPVSAERGIVVKVVNDSLTFPVPYVPNPTPSGRSYVSTTGIGTYASMCNIGFCGDLRIVALLSSDDVTIFEDGFESSP